MEREIGLQQLSSRWILGTMQYTIYKSGYN